MSWEDDTYEPELNSAAVAAVAPTDDEVKDKTWEELAEDAGSSAAGGGAAPEKLKPKHLEKAKAKERDERTAREKAEMAARLAEEEQPLSDPVAEKKRLERLQLQADMAAAREALGVGGKVTLSRDTATLVGAITLTDKEAFNTLGKLVAERVHEMSGKGTTLAMRFYTALVAVAGEKLAVDDLKALESAVAGARNRKLQAEREKAKPSAKKKGPKPNLGSEYDYDYDYDDSEAYAAPKGNSGNVAGSIAAAGFDVSAPGAAGGGDEFTRATYAAEESFM